MAKRAVRPRAHIARNLRRHATDAERILWRVLHELGPQWRFRRQHPIGTFVADFACPSHKLAIELDGGHHVDRVAEDGRRSEAIARHGYRVIRFWNHDVLGRLDDVKRSIWHELQSPPHPGPLLPNGEERETQ